jgi:predicted enzyme related to lactoylglutathione lyase
MAHGAIRWIDIPATDVDASAKFYEQAFGWKITRSETWPSYPMFMDSEDYVGGGFDAKHKPSEEPGVLIFIHVDSIENALKDVEAAGGEVVRKKALIHKEVGWRATFRDPGGNLIALWERPKE